jgi:hypothetical protein
MINKSIVKINFVEKIFYKEDYKVVIIIIFL